MYVVSCDMILTTDFKNYNEDKDYVDKNIPFWRNYRYKSPHYEVDDVIILITDWD